MIAILSQTEDDILYYCSRFTNGETIDELPFGVKVHKGNFGIDEIVIAATGAELLVPQKMASLPVFLSSPLQFMLLKEVKQSGE